MFVLFGRDFNGDGHLDILVTTGTDFVANMPIDKYNILYLNDGSGNFQQSQLGDVSTRKHYSVGVVTGDFDGDGDMDIFVVNKFQSVDNELLINNGFGIFTRALGGDATKAATSARAVVSCDIDGDGDLDIYIRGDPPVLLLNDGTGNFTQASDDVIGDIQGDYEPWSLPLCFDATGNGQMDLWVSKKSLNLNKGAWPHTEAETGEFSGGVVDAQVLDADSDGDMVRSIIIRRQGAIEFY